MKATLLEQFNTCCDENGWFVALKNTVRNLTAADAVWKPDGRIIRSGEFWRI